MNITVIGVPYDLDQPYIGKGKAPDALLDRGLAGRLGDLGYTTILAEMIDLPESDESAVTRIGRMMAKVGYEVARSRAAGFFPLIVGGDCMVALGAVSGLLDPLNTAVAWIDAHGDFNTPQTTISGYLGGMPLACIVGRGLEGLREQCKLATPVPEHNVALIGARDLDPAEEQLLRDSSVVMVRGADMRDDGAALDRALQALGSLPQLYLHVDIDVLDPAEAPGVDYPATGGLRLAELTRIIERIVSLGNLAALSLTAVNPEKDNDQQTVSAGLSAIEAALRGIKS
ncbi:MAG TPA: arginase family protein [Roseiflexaceae bacterium]|nr:arginase family protein [Roseiflexaceae bacterium]